MIVVDNDSGYVTLLLQANGVTVKITLEVEEVWDLVRHLEEEVAEAEARDEPA